MGSESPWHDRRVRLAANHAIDRRALSEAETLGASKPAGNIVPRAFELALPLEPYAYDPGKARQLLAEAGYPNGFDAGALHQLPPYFSLGEAIIDYFRAVGIRMKMRPMERGAYFYEYIWPRGIGPRVAEPALMLINPYPWSAPLEEVRLKKN